MIDKCFCYPCRKYLNDEHLTDRVFSKEGFCNWKAALEKGKGFARHESSQPHASAMLKWKEYTMRQLQGTEIHQLLSPLQIEKNQYYLMSIFDVIKFLVVNELSFRGSSEDADCQYSMGKFVSLLAYTIDKDPKLKQFVSTIPDFAKYTSPEIQNMVIDDMASIVKEKIAAMVKASDGDMFTLKCDGTRDKNNVENLSVVVRFVHNGKVHEHLLDICELGHDELDAGSITNKIMEVLAANELDPKSMISQCYDGASVMTGKRSGVQKRLQAIIGEDIPVVHCFNHQIHLVIKNALERDNDVRRVFDICNGLYNFTRRPVIAQHYDGERLKRLLDQRWTGHLATVTTVRRCYQELLDLLEAVATYSKSPGDDVVEAIGYSHQMKSLRFIISLATVENILLTFKPVNAMLQSKSMDLGTALPLLEECMKTMQDKREDSTFDTIYSEAVANVSTYEPEPKRARVRRESAAYSGHIVECSLPIYSTNNQLTTSEKDMRRIFTGIVDLVNVELASRFNERSIGFVQSMTALNDNAGDEHFLNVQRLNPLLILLQRRLDIDDLKSEIPVARNFLRNKPMSNATQDGCRVPLIQESLYPYKDAFPQMYKLYSGALTFGASTATCENSFSSLTRILCPARRSMSQSRMSNLVMLAFEKTITRDITGEELLQRFRLKKRRLVV